MEDGDNCYLLCVFWPMILNCSFSNLLGIFSLDMLKVLCPVLKLVDSFLKFCMLAEDKKRSNLSKQSTLKQAASCTWLVIKDNICN